jgi:hypothetical protein
MKTLRIKAENARKMSEEDIRDAIWGAPDNSIVEINAGDNDGVYLEIVKLDDEESVVRFRDRWPNLDGDRHIVKTNNIYAIYRALVEQVEEAP